MEKELHQQINNNNKNNNDKIIIIIIIIIVIIIIIIISIINLDSDYREINTKILLPKDKLLPVYFKSLEYEQT